MGLNFKIEDGDVVGGKCGGFLRQNAIFSEFFVGVDDSWKFVGTANGFVLGRIHVLPPLRSD